MRSALQFLASVCLALSLLLLAGAAITSETVAEVAPAPVPDGCRDCYQCNTNHDACAWGDFARGCEHYKDGPCKCYYNDRFWACRYR